MRKIEAKVPGFIENLVKHPESLAEKKIPLSLEQIQEIHDLAIAVMKKYSNLIILSQISGNFKDVLVVGDTHGELKNATARIIRPFLEEKVESLVFLGDYVDRGVNSFVNIFLLLGMVICWPDRVILLRGNHEDSYLNQHFTFFASLKEIYPKEDDFKQAVMIIDDIYNYMSLVAITPWGSACMHGGLPIGLQSVKIFSEIPKPHKAIQNIANEEKRQRVLDVFMEVRWNDPTDEKLSDPNAKSYHGYYFFTKAQVNQFLKKNDFKRVIRSHESQRGSFERMFDGVLLHVLSMESAESSNVSMGYYFGNLHKGFTIHEEPDGTTLLRDLDFNLVSKIA